MTSMWDDLDADERELLLDRLQDTLAGRSGSAPAPAAPRDGASPASFAQLRLWFLDRLEGGNVAYNLPVAVRLRGALDVEVLRRSLDEIVRRHEVLRTTFVEIDGEPRQVVGQAFRWPFELVDLTEHEGGSPSSEVVAERLRRSAWVPFDMSTGPLVRALLLRLGADDHVLGLTLHHAVADGWSMAVVLTELDAAYGALVSGGTPALDDLPLQYADYAAWQREQRSAERMTADAAYWRRQLAGAPPALALPADRASAAFGGSAGDILRTEVAPGVVAALADLSRATNTTTFMLVATALALTLGRYARTEDVVLGCPVAGRTHPQIAGLVGMFLNTLPLRLGLSGAATFRAVLQRARRTLLEAYDHQELPFEQIVEAVQPDRTLSHTPIFQVLVNHTSTRPLARTIGALDLEFMDHERPAAKFPLSLYISEEAGLEFTLVYQTALFSERRARTILDAFTGVLEQIAADADRPPAAYSLVTADAAALLPDLSAPLAAEPQPDVGRMIDHWVAWTPAAPAVEWRGRVLDYRTLGRLVAHVRALLEQGGVRQGERVAIAGRPGFAIVGALLGTLASGRIAVPLDPALPRQRLAAMVTEAQPAAVLLAGLHEVDAPFPLRDLPVLHLSDDVDVALDDDGAVAGGRAAPGDAAYVFFTSGTTGHPKGVLGCHRGLAHFLAWQRDEFGIGPGDRCAHLTGLSFDVVLRDVLLPLVSGATLVVPGDDLVPERVLGWLAEVGATVAHTVPTLAAAWLAAAGDTAVESLRHTFFAGEVLRGELVGAWRRACSRTTVVNLYGPTETTLAKVFDVVGAQDEGRRIPVGRALPGTHVLATTPAGGPCGFAEPGEVVIRTPYRTLGYLDVTDGRAFVANIGTGDADDLLYRTGDLGLLREDGRLELLGRIDRQVKIRGVRVEPDEVAAVLSSHPAVAHAAATSVTGADGMPALAAWVVPSDGATVNEAQLRSYLTKRLPGAMVPSSLGVVERIPRTPNGKIDWTALEAVRPPGGSEAAYQEPRTATEAVVAGIWTELLGVARAGRADDFFQMGGHSLLAMRLSSRLGDAFGVTVALQVLFQNPVLRDLAEAIDRQRGDGEGTTDAPLPEIVPRDRMGGSTGSAAEGAP
jgi:amino acid adenylation domain-containing protein